jgi:NlpC/P60 family/Bacterial dipeptidyl-peptidase Sh3 domain
MTNTLLDPTINPVRPDLAAGRYRDLYEAERYAEPQAYQVSAGVAPVRQAPRDDAEQLSQALFGDTVDIYEERDGFGWGQVGVDSYVGWLSMDALSSPVIAPTHKVSALRTYALAGPSARLPAFGLLSLGARLTVTAERDKGFVRCERIGWLYESHLRALDVFEPDPVAVAERFVGTPYQWGGKESLGLDCSALVQISYAAAGIALPRDSRLQRLCGEEVPIGAEADLIGLRRGDLVCWPGHVALMVNETDILHANGFHMGTVIEPLAEAADRIAATYGPILTVRRLR